MQKQTCIVNLKLNSSKSRIFARIQKYTVSQGKSVFESIANRFLLLLYKKFTINHFLKEHLLIISKYLFIFVKDKVIDNDSL